MCFGGLQRVAVDMTVNNSGDSAGQFLDRTVLVFSLAQKAVQ